MSTVNQNSLVVGGRYNWKHQPERLVYLGTDRSNGIWYQFAKVEAPEVVWCEVRAGELSMFEVTP